MNTSNPLIMGFDIEKLSFKTSVLLLIFSVNLTYHERVRIDAKDAKIRFIMRTMKTK